MPAKDSDQAPRKLPRKSRLHDPVHTDIPEAPWHVVESDDKRSARIT